ncbi:putative hydrolase or acyltransferase of alpha/beta superfamily [Caulobacter sp. AP07]|uniref:alpha/beta fold hydrolase n=1 Tax=Caulobacter sp. AP07 TaxID=1144304 RepID=UPI0002722529|nr:alpha/beta hydrolase [Caulobacter sp. AP07]EJL33295.1 putative hydrolase or acyltransferase of alpha/beta superfamily [Caulobacter sp. AP07]
MTIAFDEFGPKNAEPILLVSGLGVQMIRWAGPFCEMLAAQGYRVIRFDNRDAGLSTHLGDTPVIEIADLVQALGRGERTNLAYTLRDMADDAVGLLDALGIERAHVVGRSMGGMIAQLMAAEHPQCTLSLASIMSSTGNPKLPPPSPEAMSALMRPAPDPAWDEAGYLAHCVATARVISSPGFVFDENAYRSQALAELRRAHNPASFGRQLAAMITAGDRRAQLNTIVAPTLVAHGADDPLIPVVGGRDTAANIKDAKLMIIEGMGHDLPIELHETFALAIAANARRAAA